MLIYTHLIAEHSERFRHIKRKTSGAWTFLVSGEWSQSPVHQGNHRFYIRWSADRNYWAILSTGVPSRIVAVAHTPEPTPLETIAANMLRIIRRLDGDYIDLAHDFGDIDDATFWTLYRAKVEA